MSNVVEHAAILTCPACGDVSEHVMPINACIYFHECTRCHHLLQPLPGDCCVFCSYANVKCPPMQQASAGTQCCPASANNHPA